MLNGFVSKNGEYAAIPFGEELMIIHKGQQVSVCKTEEDARKYITNHKKGESSAKLPVD